VPFGEAAELHCHSWFSFLDGASSPEELVGEAARLGIGTLALTDHDGLYGAVRFAEAAAGTGVRTVFGAELSLGPGAGDAPAPAPPRTGVPDPRGNHLVVLARDPAGYRALARALSEAHLSGGEKGRPAYDLDRLGELGRGHLLALTGCRKGAVPDALVRAGPAAAGRALDRLVEAFGRDGVAVELWDHGDPLDSARNDALAELAVRRGVELVATNVVHYARPGQRRLAELLAAVRARRALDDLDGWLAPDGGACLRSRAEQLRRFARYPGVVERSAELGAACAFELRLVAPRLPDFPVPPGESEASFLRRLVEQGGRRRYGPRSAERVPGAWRQLDHELSVIESLGFAGYFLVVWDIVEFCRRRGIYCQGRGSAANSAVCYVLGITNADAVSLGLLFERFLSPERDGPPDIDVDIESGRREEVIQYVYERYGRERAAQVGAVVTERARGAVRDAGRAFGHPPGELDAWCRQVERWGSLRDAAGAADLPPLVHAFAEALEGLPRHLGLHSGGMVICDRPVVEVCPVEWARAEGRTVLQWDKDDCAAVGLVKFDLLGLGMLEVLHRAVDLVAAHHGVSVDLGALPQEEAVYDLLCRADTVGVFQVESRAQMATLPRLQPRRFYDLVVSVALIRPGPIQGGSVHPYLRRRAGLEPVRYPHPLLERSLAKTLGVPLFQEQLMQIAIDAAGFSPAEADELRQAMGAKRSKERMARLHERLRRGMAARGITGEVAEEVVAKLSAFASFGFPESHAISFAYLVYASAWLKLHYPAAFLAALLNAQPMGFWAPATLVADARRHGVTVLGPDVQASEAEATLEVLEDRRHAVRLGLSGVRGVGRELAERIAGGRPYRDLADLARRSGAGREALEALATAGALGSLAPLRADALAGGIGEHLGTARTSRREALWTAGALATTRPSQCLDLVGGLSPPALPPMGEVEETAADLWALGVSLSRSPMELVRSELDRQGVRPLADLAGAAPGERVRVAGIVTHRQRPATAKGTTFVNLEDETGLLNVICSRGLWARFRSVAHSAPALVVEGRLERAGDAVNLVAERLEELPLPLLLARARDFR
jgi:error-prone DNA polymerase